ncbi:hypothetical protein V499_07213 [Pseudogymnoascus sp. VKM F-103]|uniref:Uncharacterized protein n=1 Tax=Pseudogymnoascus verrucosus TaxID=342668 RepID=A0A2P2SW73_9PEZI|nr:uncharacterized protein VE01_00938 [Pseudogymnoascus verrucosus]KFY72662.1 hypothetical protein V499_07213 [Pseudogymnoascus sp. VKM F-103]OBU01028.1 hypothetical protein VE01_00938 [Pseudogymnoascus verrucosus]
MSHPASPLHRPQSTTSRDDESPLPQGQCRYLLLHPEVRGQRCACVGFSLNKCTPGSSCNCGHLAVYHLTAPTEETLADKEEVETMRARIVLLEKLLEREREAKNHLTVRVSALEEHNENGRFNADLEIRNVYRGIEGLWRHFGALDRRTRYHDDCIDALMDTTHATQDDIRTVQSRIIDLDDASMILEDRVDGLSSHPRRIENTISRRPSMTPPRQPHSRRSRSSQRSSHSGRSNRAKAWSVHISLMPTASQPFPFEKDTMAYKRVQSRGLHRVVAIPGQDSSSFVTATSNEFASLLKGRPWMPLVAKICDAEHVTGLPMLRQLPPNLIDSSLYDMDFLTAHCATLDHNGHILDLYIGMCDDYFSWSELASSPVFMPGLEACWAFDPFLDGASARDNEEAIDSVIDDLKAEDRSSAGDLLRAWSPPATRLKRTATGITRTSSFGSTDSAVSVSKKSKIGHPPSCVLPGVESRDWRGAEAVRGA